MVLIKKLSIAEHLSNTETEPCKQYSEQVSTV